MVHDHWWGRVLALAVVVSASARAAVAADSFFDKAHREDLETLARSRKPEERARAAEGLGFWSDPQAVAALTKALEDPDAAVRQNAAGALWRLYRVAGSAKAALRARLDDVPDVALRAAAALDAMGVDPDELAPARRRALGHGNPWLRFLAARGLIDDAPAAELLPPILDYYLRYADATFSDSEGRRQRDDAQSALIELARTQDRALIPPLLERLRPTTPGLKGILRSLAAFAPPPDGWRDLLIDVLAVMDTPTQKEAIEQLQKLTDEVDVRAWAPAVARLLANRGLRGEAMEALAVAGPIAHEHAPAIAQLLLKGNERERETAAETLGRIGDRTAPGTQAEKESVARAALPGLREAIREDIVGGVCARAAAALDQLQLDPSLAAAALADGLDGVCPGSVLFALKRRGGEAAAALPALEAYHPRAGARADDVEETLAAIRSGEVRQPTLALTLPSGGADAEVRAHSYLRAMGIAFDEDALTRALLDADRDAVAAFLDAGVPPDHVFAKTNGRTAVGSLVRLGPCGARVRPTPDDVRETLELLIARGADVNRPNAAGTTPLMDAVGNGCDRTIMRTLIRAGARGGDRDAEGFTAFELGLRDGHDGPEELIAAGFRLTASEAARLLASYRDDPAARALVRRATAPAKPVPLKRKRPADGCPVRALQCYHRDPMFGTLGGPEIFLILVIALIVFGPRKLPEIGKTMGKMLAEFRKASSDFKRTIEDEVEAEKALPAVAEGIAPVAVTAGPEPEPVPVPPETPTVSRLEGDRVQPPAAMETPSRLEPPAPPHSPAADEPAAAPAESTVEIKPA